MLLVSFIKVEHGEISNHDDDHEEVHPSFGVLLPDGCVCDLSESRMFADFSNFATKFRFECLRHSTRYMAADQRNIIFAARE
jgi:hypothetical protein